MAIIAQIKKDIAEARNIWLPWWSVFAIALAALPIIYLFDQAGQLDLALPFLNSVAVVVFLLALKWKSRRQAWLWITMTALCALLALIVWLAPWPKHWAPAAVIAGVSTLGFFLMIVVLAVVEQYVTGKTTSRE